MLVMYIYVGANDSVSDKPNSKESDKFFSHDESSDLFFSFLGLARAG